MHRIARTISQAARMVSSSAPILRLVINSHKKGERFILLHQFDFDFDLRTMHLYSVCALFLLALVACQAAPSPKVIEKSINEAETTFDKNAILEETGADKGRAKKSATTFCVEVRSGKPEQVPCRQEVRQDIAKPLVILQPIPIPGPGYSEPIPPPPQPSPSISLNQQQQSSQVVNPPPAPVPAPAPVQTPAPAPIPIINIVPQAPAPVTCDKPQQPQQPQQIHTVHVIHPQPQLPQRPSVMVIQPSEQEKPVPKPQNLPVPLQEFNVLRQRPPTCKNCTKPIPPKPLNLLVQPRPFVQPTALFDVLPRQVKSDGCNNQEESYECNCRPENRIPTLTPYVTSRFLNGPQKPRAMTYHDGAPIESPMPYRSSQMSKENNPSMMPSMMSDQPIFFRSEETHRGMEGRHKKQYPPVNLSVQFPVVYPGSGNSPKYYEPVYQPSYTNPSPTYAYPNSYQVYGNYGNPYPTSYGSQPSASVPAITINTAGPFYRESQHVDSLSQSNEMEMLPGEAHSTATEMIDDPNNQKREVDVTQLKSEHEEITQKEK